MRTGFDGDSSGQFGLLKRPLVGRPGSQATFHALRNALACSVHAVITKYFTRRRCARMFLSVVCSSRSVQMRLDDRQSLMIAAQVLLPQATQRADAINGSECGFLTLVRMTQPEALTSTANRSHRWQFLHIPRCWLRGAGAAPHNFESRVRHFAGFPLVP